MAKQSIDPALLALQTAKKAMPASPSTQAVAKPSLNVPKQQPQATYTNITPPVAKIGGISSPFWAANINSSPILWWATPQEIGTRAKELQSLPKAMPATWSEPVKKLSIDDFANKIKEKYPEYKDKDNKTLAEAVIKKYPEYKDRVAIDNGNFITDLWSGVWQSVAWFGNLWKKLAFWAVDLYRQSQGKEKLTPEQRASAEQTPMWQALNTITNRQTPEEKASIWWQIGMVAWSVAQWAALWTPLTSTLLEIPRVAQIATKAPVLSKIVWWIAQGLEWQLQYSAAAEWKLPTSKELLTAWVFWWSVNAIWPIAKWIKENIKLPKITTPTVASKADDRANQMLTNMNRITKWEQEKFAAQQGKTVWQFLNDKGIVSWWEKTIEKVAKWFIESKNKADEWLALIKGNYKNEYLSTMANEAAEFAENTLSPEASKIRALAQKADDIWLTMSESNIIKRFYERNNKFTYGRDITAWEKTVRATNLDNYVRNRQMEIADQNWLSNLREINKDTQWFKYILDKLVKNEDWRLWNNAIWLTDWIVAWEVASNPSAIGLLVWKKIASSNRFRTWVVKILNRLSWHTNEADKILDIWRIMQIQNEKDLNKFLALPLKKNVPTPSIPLNSNRGIQWMVKWTNIANTPKPMAKTPPITVEKWAIGMWTPKVNKTPVIPPKATVAPSVSAPKKWMPKLWKETLEQNRYHWWTKKIDSFDISKAKEWNYWKWIYLTDNPKLAEYYWGLKIDNEALNNLPKGSLNFPERQKWIVSEFSIPKNIKIKELKTPPSKKEIEAIKNQWYDWVKFPDTLEKQDWDYRLLWDYQDWNTVFVFNTDKFNKKSLPPLPKKWK